MKKMKKFEYFVVHLTAKDTYLSVMNKWADRKCKVVAIDFDKGMVFMKQKIKQ